MIYFGTGGSKIPGKLSSRKKEEKRKKRIKILMHLAVIKEIFTSSLEFEDELRKKTKIAIMIQCYLVI